MATLTPSSVAAAEARPLGQDPDPTPAFRRATGAALLAAVVVFVVGALAWATTGVDYDTAVETGTVPEILPDIVANSTALSVCFGLWLLGSILFAIAGGLMSRTASPNPLATAAGAVMGVGAALGVTTFVIMLTLVHGVAGAATPDPELATAVTRLASTGDWVTTILLIAVGPMMLVLAGRNDWAPRWLSLLGGLSLLAATATIVALVTGSGLATYGFVLVPVGMVFTTTTGVVLWRRV